MHQIKTQLAEFSAAHRLIKGYQGVCQHLHGHNYRVFLTFSATEYDEFDFVVDFSDVKSVCNQWVKDHWDHAMIISSDDAPLLQFAQENQQRHYVIPDGKNSTVEVLSHHLFELLSPEVEQKLAAKNKTLRLTEVEIWETQKSCGRFTTVIPAL